jgi:two-component system, cell cycle response regulator
MLKTKIRVLIVDDSGTTRSLITKYLGDNYEAIHAVNGEEGWRIVEQDEAVSLVFADMHMPVLNGMLLLKRMRESEIERISSLPVIIITGHEDSEVAKRASYNIGATDFLSKPFDRVDILCHAGSYTRDNRAITTLEKDTARNVLTDLYHNKLLSTFGNKAISFGARHGIHVSIMYIQIADADRMIAAHGNILLDKIVDKITALLNESLRKEELIASIGNGRFAVVLPATKAFKANIVASRLQHAVERLSFQLSDLAVKVKLAIGISSTESSEAVTHYLTFGEYCIQAAHALRMSLESRNSRVVRFDETYEKKVMDESMRDRDTKLLAAEQYPPAEEHTVTSDGLGDIFADILVGDYGKIPASYLATLIEPLEKFLAYAREADESAAVKAVDMQQSPDHFDDARTAEKS